MSTKIFYIAHARLPTEKAHGIQIMKMCEAFAGAGVSVELIVPRRLNPIQTDAFEYYGVKKNFTITRIPVLDTVAWGRIGFWFELLQFLFFTRLYLVGKRGVVYTREEAAGLLWRDFILELHHKPHARVLLPRRVFVLTQLLKNDIAPHPARVLPDAVDLAQFDLSISPEDARAKLGLPQDRKIVLYAGSFSLYPWKGVDTVLQAAKNFQSQTLFVLVGGEGSSTDNLLFVPHQPYARIPLYLKAADILVLPNKKGDAVSERYTSPLKLFEYLAAERPIVCADLPSLREVVGEREVVFFEPNRPDSLAAAIREILSDPTRAADIARKARNRAADFTWGARANTVLAFIKN